MFVLLFIFVFVPVRRHHYITHVNLQFSISDYHVEIFSAISSRLIYLKFNIIISSCIYIILKNNNI